MRGVGLPKGVASDVLLMARREPRRTLARLAGTSVGLLAVIILVTLTAAGRADVDRQFERWSARGFSTSIAPEQAEQVWRGRVAVLERTRGRREIAAIGPVLSTPDVPVDVSIGGQPIQRSGMRVVQTTTAALDALNVRISPDNADQPLTGVYVGSRIADELGLGEHIAAAPVGIQVQGVAFPVLGEVERSERRSDLLSSVVIVEDSSQPPLTWSNGPLSTFAGDLAFEVRTTNGGAAAAAALLPVAIAPSHPEAVITLEAPDLASLRTQIAQAGYGSAVVASAAISLFGAIVVGAIGFVQVSSRRHEIGLRRVCGATGSDIARLLALDAMGLGLLGGLVAASLGSTISAIVLVARDLPVVVVWWPIAAAPAAGLWLGLLAGLPPAIRASRMSPRSALQI